MKSISNKVMKKGLVVTYINYDSDLDILELYTNEKVHHSVNLSDFVIASFNSKKKLVGLELMDLSTQYQIPKKVLENIKNAEIYFKATDRIILIKINLQIINQKNKEVVLMPM